MGIRNRLDNMVEALKVCLGGVKAGFFFGPSNL